MNHMVGTGHPTSAHPFFLPPPPSLIARPFLCGTKSSGDTQNSFDNDNTKIALCQAFLQQEGLKDNNFLTILKQIGLKIHNYE